MTKKKTPYKGTDQHLATRLRTLMEEAQKIFTELERRGYTVQILGTHELDHGEFPAIGDMWKEVTTRTEL